MNITKTTSIAVISVIATLAVASIFGLQISSIIAEEDEDTGYKFAEGVDITGEFFFKEGTEVSKFEVFNQDTGIDSKGIYVFTVEKIVGETPLLHKMADTSYKLRSSPGELKQGLNVFDVNIILSQDGAIKRSFSYHTCFVSNYEVSTDFDKEEGWMGKGFAVKDNFEIQCSRYQPNNPVYVEMIAPTEKASTKSTLAYNEEQRNLFGN